MFNLTSLHLEGLMRSLLGLCAIVIVLGVAFQSHPTHPTSVQAESKPLAVNQPQLDKCDKLLTQFAKQTGTLKSYDVDGKIGTVEVRGAYYALPFDAKQTLNSVLRCVMTDGRQDESVDFIDYMDYRTHKTVAKWSPYTGFSVE